MLELIEAKFDVLAFTKEEIEDLERSLQSLGPVRMQKAYKERGGTETTLWLVLKFIGGAYAAGLVGHIAVGHFNKLLSIVSGFYNRFNVPPTSPQAISLTISYDDLEIELNLPIDADLAFMNRTYETVIRRLQEEPLTALEVTRVWLPLVFNNEESVWYQPHYLRMSELDLRYWGISVAFAPFVMFLYDSLNNEFSSVEASRVDV